jgi:hypothetical protein
MTRDDHVPADPEGYIHLPERIAHTAEWWSKIYFDQPWVEVREIAENANTYPNGVYGYAVIVVMPAYPHGLQIEVLVESFRPFTARIMHA